MKGREREHVTPALCWEESRDVAKGCMRERDEMILYTVQTAISRYIKSTA